MGARAFSHSGFRCGRRGARSIWTSSTELAIKYLDVNLYCTMLGRPFAGVGTEVTFQPPEIGPNFRPMGENLRKLVRKLAALHAPLGHWAPLAASILFAGAGMSHSAFLRFLAYCGAS